MQSMTASTDGLAESEGVLQGYKPTQSTNMTQDEAFDPAPPARSAVTVELLPHKASHAGEDKPSVSVRLTETAHQGMKPCFDSAKTIWL